MIRPTPPTPASFDLTIGLFGTCGKSSWRKSFIERYESLGIPYFNPQVENWNSAFAQEEAVHLVADGIVLFPVTNESYATGSLAETGFSILSAIRANSHRYILIWIAADLDPVLKEENPLAAQESMRARSLVRAHVRENRHPNVFIVEGLSQMLAVSILLHQSLRSIASARALIEGHVA